MSSLDFAGSLLGSSTRPRGSAARGWGSWIRHALLGAASGLACSGLVCSGLAYPGLACSGLVVRSAAEGLPARTSTALAAEAGAVSPANADAQQAKGRLRGEISFSRQEPAPGAVVVLIRDGDPGTLFAAMTDRDGGFRFEGIPEGNWSLGVVFDGAAPVVKESVPVKPPARAVVDIVMKKTSSHFAPPLFDLARFESSGLPAVKPSGSGQLTIRVVDAGMKPIREARIVLKSRGPMVDPLRVVTDGDGGAELPPPAPGEYTLRVEMPGYLPLRLERIALGHTAPKVGVVLTPRPLDYPARPADLVPEEKPVPPAGFPGAAPGHSTGDSG